MKLSSTASRKPLFPCVAIALASMVAACGGTYSDQTSSNPSPTNPPPPGSMSVISMQGSWVFYFHSDSSPKDFIVLEANVSQAGTHVYAGATSALLYQGESAIPYIVGVNRFGGKCDSGGKDEIIFDGTLSNQSSTSETVTFTLSENGVLGTSVMSASATTNGLNTSDGTYTLPAGCGFPEEHGTFLAYQGYPDFMRFSGADIYHGKFNGGTDSISVSFASDLSGFELTATGTDNGAPFTLSGSTIGFSMTLTGTVSGHNVVWFGLYDGLYNTFAFCDSDAKSLGSLSENPFAP
jgi:hypothetical protein